MNWPDKLSNIVEICIALDIAILGIAYPIIVDKISTIGDKYGSRYISNVFESTFPQRKVGFVFKKREYKISLFKLVIYTTLSTFIFQIFEFKPLFSYDDWLRVIHKYPYIVQIFPFDHLQGYGKCIFWVINNSADLLVFFSSSLLIVLFFIWLNKVALFNGKSTSLLNELIAIYNNSTNDSIDKNYCLKAINELTYYAVEKQDEHLQTTFLIFYTEIFSTIRRIHNINEPLSYPIDFYELVYKLCGLFVIVKNTKLLNLEKAAVNGEWFFGGDTNIPISQTTYIWLWRYLCVICDNEKLVRMFWANSSQYFTYYLDRLDEQYDTNWIIQNEEQIKRRDNERKLFKDINYALGGLLLYKKQYKTIHYMFEYSQSDPPKYVLLPASMTRVFEVFNYFSDNYKELPPIDMKFPFPDLDNLGNSGKVIYWICSYITLLFVRQYTLVEQYVNQNHTSQPDLPNKIRDLYRWQNNIPYFRKCLEATISNVELLKELGFEKIVEEKRDDFIGFLQILDTSIQQQVDHIQQVAELSPEKLDAFKTASQVIITNAFQQYQGLFSQNNYESGEGDLRLSVLGNKTLFAKSAFTDTDITYMNYNTIFAESIAKYSIKKYIPNSFFAAKTKSYLLDIDNLKVGLERIISNINDTVIIGFNTSFQTEKLLRKLHINTSFYAFVGGDFGEALFILRRSDLPTIEHKDLNVNEISKQKLVLLNEKLKTYYSIVDINKPENEELKKQWPNDQIEGELKVQITIAFFSIITWKKGRKVVEVNIYSPYKEQGIKSELNEIEPL